MGRSLSRALHALAVSAVAAACSDSQQAVPVDVRLSASTLWAGDTLRLYSAGFAPPAASHVLIDGVAATAVAADDTTLAVALPLLAGDVVITVTGDLVVPLDTVVHTHGFRSVVTGPLLTGVPVPYPGRYAVTFFAADTGGARLLSALTMVGPSYPRSMHDARCGRGPGPSYDTMAIVLATSGTSVCGGKQQQWKASPTFVLTDSGQTTGMGYWSMGQLGPQVWYKGVHHSVCVTGPAAAPCPVTTGVGEAPTGVRISPKGDRAIALMYPAADAAPVWDATTGAVAYSIPGLNELAAAAFSVSGDTLYVVGDTPALGDSMPLIALNATTGTELSRRQLAPTFYSRDLFVSSDGRYLLSVSDAPALHVFALPSLTQVAVLRVPAASACAGVNGCGFLPRILGDGKPNVFVVFASGAEYTSNTFVGPSYSFGFDLKP